MTANQIEQAIKQLIGLIITWAKLIGGLALALIVLGSLAAAAGHAIPLLATPSAGSRSWYRHRGARLLPWPLSHGASHALPHSHCSAVAHIV
jgi:hypothetical protein